jgi:hypothetical protein
MLQQTASGEWVPVPPRPPSTANNPFGIRPGEASTSALPSTTGSLPSTNNPFSSATGSTRASTGGTVTATPTGTIHTAPPPPWKTRAKLGAKLGAYTTAGLAALYAGYKGLEYLVLSNSGYALRDLDPVDQENIKKNFKILEPYVVPEVFKDLPADVQTRVVSVLDQLKKLGMSAGGDKAGPATPATAASAAAPAAEAPFSDILQNANRYVKGVRESVEPDDLSETQKMARLRDLVQEDIPSTIAAIAGSGITDAFVQQIINVGEGLGLGYLAKRIPNYYLGLEALVKRYRADVPGGTAKDFWKWLAKAHFPTWADVGLGAAGIVGWAIYQWFQVKATTGAADAAVTALTKTWPAENDALKVFKDQMATMTPAQYNALSDDAKDKIDETWIYYCSKFPNDKIGNQTCFDFVHNPKNGICTYHPDWAGCKKPSSTP